MKLFSSTRNLLDFAVCVSLSASAQQSAMDRMKNSMQQVPNAIPKVIRRTGGANSLELEKENFERGQVRSRNATLIKSVESCVGKGGQLSGEGIGLPLLEATEP